MLACARGVPKRRFWPESRELYCRGESRDESDVHLPARQPVRRKQRRQPRPVSRPPARPVDTAGAVGEATPSPATTEPRAARPQPPMSATRMALAARSAEMARLDVEYMRHDLRNVALIAGLMLVVIIVLYFVPSLR